MGGVPLPQFGIFAQGTIAHQFFERYYATRTPVVLTDDDLRVLIAESAIFAHRRRGLTPDRPVLRGTAPFNSPLRFVGFQGLGND